LECADCGKDKQLAEFPRGTNPLPARPSRCKACKNARSRQRIKASWGNTRHYHLVQKYGMTAAEVEILKSSQGGLCAVCRCQPAVHVDHDHKTGQVRGVVCESCNGFLGAFGDDPALIEAAIAYLEKPR
jgi:hypothetical protein